MISNIYRLPRCDRCETDNSAVVIIRRKNVCAKCALTEQKNEAMFKRRNINAIEQNKDYY